MRGPAFLSQSGSRLRLGWDFFTAVIILITAFGAAAAIHTCLETVSHKKTQVGNVKNVIISPIVERGTK